MHLTVNDGEIVVLHEAEGGHRIVPVGSEVHRPLTAGSSSVHKVLHHLEDVGFEGAPRLLGVSGDHERTTVLRRRRRRRRRVDGVLPETGLAAAAGLLRRYHDAVRSFRGEPDAAWSSGDIGGPMEGEVILHGDPGPWNMVWRDGMPVALIDWDHAYPGDPIDDAAYLAVYAAPLCPDQEAIDWMRHPGPPDRRRRLAIVADAYGTSPEVLIDRAPGVIGKANRALLRLAALGQEPQAAWRRSGLLDTFVERHQWIETYVASCRGQ